MNKQITLGTILQYLQMFASILIGLIYTPIMLRLLGQSEYGLYNLASSIISYLSLLSLGFGSSYIRFYTIRKKNDPARIKNLNGLYLITFLFIGFIALIAGLILSFNVNIFFNETYTINDLNIAKHLMILLTINLAISFPMSLFTSYITSQEKFIFLKLVNIGKTVLSPGLSIIALFMGYGSVGLVAATTVINIVIDFINIFYCFKKIKMSISFKQPEFKLLRDIFVFSFFIAINQLIDQINWQTDKIILGKMITSAAVSIYAIGSTFNAYFIGFSTAVSSLFTPRINKIVSDNKPTMNSDLTKLMAKVGRIQFFILSLVLLGFIFFGSVFIKWWAGPEYGESYYIALLLMVPELVPLIQNIGIEIQRAKNMHKFRSLVYLAMALINVGVSIALCTRFGVVGVAVGTTISLVIANGILMNIYYHVKIGIDMKYFWLEILKIIPSLILPTAAGALFMLTPTETGIDFIRHILCFVAIYCASICAFGFNQDEKLLLLKK